MSTVFWLLIIVLVAMAVIGVPDLRIFAHHYGYTPSGVLAVIVIVLLILVLMQ